MALPGRIPFRLSATRVETSTRSKRIRATKPVSNSNDEIKREGTTKSSETAVDNAKVDTPVLQHFRYSDLPLEIRSRIIMFWLMSKRRPRNLRTFQEVDLPIEDMSDSQEPVPFHTVYTIRFKPPSRLPALLVSKDFLADGLHMFSRTRSLSLYGAKFRSIPSVTETTDQHLMQDMYRDVLKYACNVEINGLYFLGMSSDVFCALPHYMPSIRNICVFDLANNIAGERNREELEDLKQTFVRNPDDAHLPKLSSDQKQVLLDACLGGHVELLTEIKTFCRMHPLVNLVGWCRVSWILRSTNNPEKHLGTFSAHAKIDVRTMKILEVQTGYSRW